MLRNSVSPKIMIKKIVNELSKINSVTAIILFGSRVIGNARKDSDYDIAILTKDSTEDEDLDIMSWGNDMIDISLFHRLPIIIKFRVLKEGKILFCRNKKDIYDTKVWVFREYLDFSSFMNRFYNRIIENV